MLAVFKFAPQADRLPSHDMMIALRAAVRQSRTHASKLRVQSLPLCPERAECSSKKLFSETWPARPSRPASEKEPGLLAGECFA